MSKRPPPPTYFVASLVLMAALAFAWPLAPLFAWPWRALGVVPIAAGVWLNLAADRAFKERGTTVKPFERSSALVTNGVFRISRNPMYLGMVVILVRAAALLGALPPFLVAAGFATILEMHFIPVEERMLAETFGEEWAAWSKRVRGAGFSGQALSFAFNLAPEPETTGPVELFAARSAADLNERDMVEFIPFRQSSLRTHGESAVLVRRQILDQPQSPLIQIGGERLRSKAECPGSPTLSPRGARRPRP